MTRAHVHTRGLFFWDVSIRNSLRSKKKSSTTQERQHARGTRIHFRLARSAGGGVAPRRNKQGGEKKSEEGDMILVGVRQKLLVSAKKKQAHRNQFEVPCKVSRQRLNREASISATGHYSTTSTHPK